MLNVSILKLNVCLTGKYSIVEHSHIRSADEENHKNILLGFGNKFPGVVTIGHA